MNPERLAFKARDDLEKEKRIVRTGVRVLDLTDEKGSLWGKILGALAVMSPM